MEAQRLAETPERAPPAAFGCPHCHAPLRPAGDMWGPYWLCEECGFAVEEERELLAAASGRPARRPAK